MVKQACLAFRLGKCLNCACVYLATLFGGMPRIYKITVAKGDIRKPAKSMLNVSGKRREIPVTPSKRELR